MEDKNEKHYTDDGKEVDFFSRPPPGYALTQTPGKFPWDKPPKFTDPDEAYDHLMQKIFQKESIKQIVDLLEMEVPPTLIAQSMVNMAWSRGMISPDVAELIKPSIAIDITLIGSQADVDINFGDESDLDIDYKKIYLDDKKKRKSRFEEDEKDIEEPLKARAQDAIKGLMSKGE